MFILVESEQNGMQMNATKEISPGTLILKEQLFAAVAFNETTCSMCFSEGSKFRCAGCSKLSYCSQMCQRRDFKAHKFECRYLKGMQSLPAFSVRLLARLLYKIHRDPTLLTLSKSNKSRINQTGLDRFLSHRDEMDLSNFEEMALAMRDMIDRDFLLESSHLVDLLCICSTNNVGIMNDEQIAVGVGLFIDISMINHSCTPNAAIYFENNTARLIALREISSGDEITLSYIDPCMSLEARQLELNKYCFICKCVRCESESSSVTHRLFLLGQSVDLLIERSDWRGVLRDLKSLIELKTLLFGALYPSIALLEYQLFRCAKLVPEISLANEMGLNAIKSLTFINPNCDLLKRLTFEYGEWRGSQIESF